MPRMVRNRCVPSNAMGRRLGGLPKNARSVAPESTAIGCPDPRALVCGIPVDVPADSRSCVPDRRTSRKGQTLFQRILVAVDNSPAAAPSSTWSATCPAGRGRDRRRTWRPFHLAPRRCGHPENEDDVEDILGEMLTRLREAGVEAESTVAGALTTQIAATVSSAAEEWEPTCWLSARNTAEHLKRLSLRGSATPSRTRGAPSGPSAVRPARAPPRTGRAPGRAPRRVGEAGRWWRMWSGWWWRRRPAAAARPANAVPAAVPGAEPSSPARRARRAAPRSRGQRGRAGHRPEDGLPVGVLREQRAGGNAEHHGRVQSGHDHGHRLAAPVGDDGRDRPEPGVRHARHHRMSIGKPKCGTGAAATCLATPSSAIPRRGPPPAAVPGSARRSGRPRGSGRTGPGRRRADRCGPAGRPRSVSRRGWHPS